MGNHDLFVMNTDGSNVRQITKGENVDWFSRFSPDGTRILFTRSKKGWVFERDANTDGKWDIFTVTPDGKDETKIVDNASWGSWISNDEIVYARSTAIFRRKLGGGDETLLVDSTKVKDLDGALLQQPELSKDGDYIAITLRGSKRETGIWDVRKKTWTRTGEGCQINWTPNGSEVYWVHPTGNGGSRVLHMPMTDGKAAKSDSDLDALTLIDIPGRRSHEYFPPALRRRKMAGLGGHPARPRPRHRGLRDLSVGGRRAARNRRPADLSFGQRSLARHLHPGRGSLRCQSRTCFRTHPRGDETRGEPRRDRNGRPGSGDRRRP